LGGPSAICTDACDVCNGSEITKMMPNKLNNTNTAGTMHFFTNYASSTI
jgi:hypothetical protein